MTTTTTTTRSRARVKESLAKPAHSRVKTAIRARSGAKGTQARHTSAATWTSAAKAGQLSRETVTAPLPHGFLAGASPAPTVQKLPFAALALLGLAILLLALGALPATAMPLPAAASVLASRRTEIAVAGLATLAASIAAYWLI
jgi:hypothetical protein